MNEVEEVQNTPGGLVDFTNDRNLVQVDDNFLLDSSKMVEKPSESPQLQAIPSTSTTPSSSGSGSPGSSTGEKVHDTESAKRILMNLVQDSKRKGKNSPGSPEIAKVLENFNAILENEDVELYAELLMTGDNEEDLLIVDVTDDECPAIALKTRGGKGISCGGGGKLIKQVGKSTRHQFGNHLRCKSDPMAEILRVHLTENVDDLNNKSDAEQPEEHFEEGYESDRPMVRASMRKLRPVQLLPIPASMSTLPTILSSPGNSSTSSPSSCPVTPPEPSCGFATTLNSPVTNKILVTSLINNILCGTSSISMQQQHLNESLEQSQNNENSASEQSRNTTSTSSTSILNEINTNNEQNNNSAMTNQNQNQRQQNVSVSSGDQHQNNVNNLSSNVSSSTLTTSTAPSAGINSSTNNLNNHNNNHVSSIDVNSEAPPEYNDTIVIQQNVNHNHHNNQSTPSSAISSTNSPGSSSTANSNSNGNGNSRPVSSNNGAGVTATTASTTPENTTTPTTNASQQQQANHGRSRNGRTTGRATANLLGPGLRMPQGLWPHRLSSVLALIGCTLGLNNICRFSLLSVNYGANFVLQFLFLSLVFGIPLFAFHMSIGQYLSSGPVDMWRISPIFQGIGLGLIISQAMIGVYTAIGVSWMFVFFRDSFITKHDIYRWQKCLEYNRDCNGYTNSSDVLIDSVPDYFNGVVLQRHNSDYPQISHFPSSLKFTLAFNLAVVWMIIFICLSKGLKSYGKVVHGFVIFASASILVLASKMIGLVPAENSSQIFGQTSWGTFFFNSQTWVVAAREAFYTWGLLGACIMQVTSHNRYTHSLKTDVSIVVFVTTFVLLLSAFLGNACYYIINSYGYTYMPSSFESERTYKFLMRKTPYSPHSMNSGNFGQSDNVNIHIPFLMGVRVIRPDSTPSPTNFGVSSVDINTVSGYQVLRLATELFPTTISLLGSTGLSPFWTVLFYLSLILFGLAQQLAIWHCVIKGFIAIKSKVLRSWETTITFFVCGIGFALGLILCTELGIFVEYFLDFAIGSGWWVMVLYLMELIAVFIIRGSPYVRHHYENFPFLGLIFTLFLKIKCGENIVTVLMTGSSRIVKILAPLVSFIWNVILPVAMLVLCIASFKSGGLRELYDWTPSHGYAFWPTWTKEVGSLIQLLPILCVPFVAIVQSCRYLSQGPADLFDRMQQLYRPHSRGIFRNRNLSSHIPHDSDSDVSNNRTSSNSRSNEEAPPKYSPPPSFSTATGAKIAKFLRNSFRRSMRRLGSPTAGGPSTSSILPPPPDYNSIFANNPTPSAAANININTTPSGVSHISIPILVTPPQSQDHQVIQHHQNQQNLESSSVNIRTADQPKASLISQIKLSQSLGRTLGLTKSTGNEKIQGKDRGSIRRISSDISPSDVARILRASFRRESNSSATSHNNHNNLSPPLSPKTQLNMPILHHNSPQQQQHQQYQQQQQQPIFSVENDYLSTTTGSESVSVSVSSGNNTHMRHSSFPTSLVNYNLSRSRNSNDSQLALIYNEVGSNSSSLNHYQPELFTNAPSTSISSGIENPTFQIRNQNNPETSDA